MKDVLGLIPHVFYDLIGRIAPGAVTLFMGVILLTDDGGSRALPLIFGEKPMVSLAAIFFAMLLAAYVLGFVLGAIGALFEDGLNAPKFETIAKAGAAAPRKDIRFADLSYIYDFILLRNPAAGSRLAKLRAEHHMCGALLVGSLSLAAFYAFRRWGMLDRDGALVLTSLGLTGFAAVIFRRHLTTRAWRLQVNYWLLLHTSSELVEPSSTELAESPSHTSVVSSESRIRVRTPGAIGVSEEIQKVGD